VMKAAEAFVLRPEVMVDTEQVAISAPASAFRYGRFLTSHYVVIFSAQGEWKGIFFPSSFNIHISVNTW
jgi:hypothetical protein